MKTTWRRLFLVLTVIIFALMTALVVVNAFAMPPDALPENGWTDVAWKHADVSGWEKTATLKSVSIVGDQIVFPYDGGDWPEKIVFDTVLTGNCWAMINYNGQWTAFTFDFLRLLQYSKPAHAVEEAAHEAGLNWYPTTGEETYIWISGLARTADRNALERSNVIRYHWNEGTAYPEPEPTCDCCELCPKPPPEIIIKKVPLPVAVPLGGSK